MKLQLTCFCFAVAFVLGQVCRGWMTPCYLTGRRYLDSSPLMTFTAAPCPNLTVDIPAPRLPDREPVHKLIILLHTSAATLNDRVATVRETWLSEALPEGVKVVWVSDGEVPEVEYSLQVNSSPRPGLRPEPLPRMNERVVQSLIKSLNADYGLADWYLKVDDDTYVNVTNVVKLVGAYEIPAKTAHYIGKCDCRFENGIGVLMNNPFYRDHYGDLNQFLPKEGGPEVYACGGGGYLLSLSAVRQFVEYEQNTGAPRMGEDSMMGWTMQVGLGHTCTNRADAFLDYGPLVDISTAPDHTLCQSIAGFHKALPELMRYLHKCATTGDSTWPAVEESQNEKLIDR